MKKNFGRTKTIFSSATIFFALICMVFLLTYAVHYINNTRNSSMPINNVKTTNKKIALTFDVAWGTKNLDKILKILDKHKVKATFFVVGSWIDNNKEYAKEISLHGHEIGNHSDTYVDFNEVSEDDIIKEINSANKKISDVSSQNNKIVRPPYGDANSKTVKVCKSMGYKVVRWNLDSYDWKELGPNHVIEKVMNEVNPGSIILFHTNVSGVENYLDTILTMLEKKGYSMVNVSSLLYKNNYAINSNGVQFHEK